LLRECGAELVEFSPISDLVLPADLDGIYFGGGYPELHAEALAANAGMRRGGGAVCGAGRSGVRGMRRLHVSDRGNRRRCGQHLAHGRRFSDKGAHAGTAGEAGLRRSPRPACGHGARPRVSILDDRRNAAAIGVERIYCRLSGPRGAWQLRAFALPIVSSLAEAFVDACCRSGKNSNHGKRNHKQVRGLVGRTPWSARDALVPL
jgi:hypothetical protein